MLKTLFLSLILSASLLATPNQAKAYVPIGEIIVGLQIATAVAVAAKPLVKMAYKTIKKGAKDIIHFVKRHRANHKQKRDILDEESFAHPSAPALVYANQVHANQDLDERVNTVALIPQTYGYSRSLKVVRYEEEMTYFGGGF
tara:strand:+ start:2493 stop:2921 length:429 start_codon:yes stop_codon:yes gene_type:complete